MILAVMSIAPSPSIPRLHRSELAPPGAPTRVAVAAAVLETTHNVVRDQDDTDEDYAARRRLMDAALGLPTQD